MSETGSKAQSEGKHLHQSEASYYNPISCQWQKGIFTLKETYFEFKTEGCDDNSPFHLSLPLCTISLIQKKNSRFIYPSLVIHTGSETHWFSSFPSRDAIYNLLELFWRNVLLAKSKPSLSEAAGSKIASPLGKKLLSILHESEESLSNTARMLDHQGEQLNEAQNSVHDLNSDLSTVPKSALLLLPLCPSTSQADKSSNSKTKVRRIRKRKYKVTFTTSGESDENANEWEKGFVVFFTDLQLLDEEENLKFQMSASEISSIMIISPWELSIKHESNGTITTYKIMCPMLSNLHKILVASPIFQEKIVYKDDCEDSFQTSRSQSSMSIASSSTSDMEFQLPSCQALEQKFAEVLTDEEIHEISSVLSGLQTLAVGVGKEQESQMEKIKHLADEMERTDCRIRAENNRIKKLNM